MDGASSIAGIVGLAGLTVQACIVLRDFCSHFQDASHNVLEILDDLEEIQSVLDQIAVFVQHKRLQAKDVEALERRMLRCKADIEYGSLKIKAISPLGKRPIKRAAASFKIAMGNSQFEELRGKIQSHKGQLTLQLEILGRDLDFKIADEVNNLKQCYISSTSSMNQRLSSIESGVSQMQLDNNTSLDVIDARLANIQAMLAGQMSTPPPAYDKKPKSRNMYTSHRVPRKVKLHMETRKVVKTVSSSSPSHDVHPMMFRFIKTAIIMQESKGKVFTELIPSTDYQFEHANDNVRKKMIQYLQGLRVLSWLLRKDNLITTVRSFSHQRTQTALTIQGDLNGTYKRYIVASDVLRHRQFQAAAGHGFGLTVLETMRRFFLSNTYGRDLFGSYLTGFSKEELDDKPRRKLEPIVIVSRAQAQRMKPFLRFLNWHAELKQIEEAEEIGSHHDVYPLQIWSASLVPAISEKDRQEMQEEKSTDIVQRSKQALQPLPDHKSSSLSELAQHRREMNKVAQRQAARKLRSRMTSVSQQFVAKPNQVVAEQTPAQMYSPGNFHSFTAEFGHGSEQQLPSGLIESAPESVAAASHRDFIQRGDIIQEKCSPKNEAMMLPQWEDHYLRTTSFQPDKSLSDAGFQAARQNDIQTKPTTTAQLPKSNMNHNSVSNYDADQTSPLPQLMNQSRPQTMNSSYRDPIMQHFPHSSAKMMSTPQPALKRAARQFHAELAKESSYGSLPSVALSFGKEFQLQPYTSKPTMNPQMMERSGPSSQTSRTMEPDQSMANSQKSPTFARQQIAQQQMVRQQMAQQQMPQKAAAVRLLHYEWNNTHECRRLDGLSAPYASQQMLQESGARQLHSTLVQQQMVQQQMVQQQMPQKAAAVQLLHWEWNDSHKRRRLDEPSIPHASQQMLQGAGARQLHSTIHELPG